MAYSGLGDSLWNEVEDVLVGNVFGTNTTVAVPEHTTKLFADDEFFHPLVIHDNEACKWILHAKVAHIGIRLWDLLHFVPCSAFLTFLLMGAQKSVQRLRGMTLALAMGALYGLVVMVALSGLTRSFLTMLVGTEMSAARPEKVFWVGARFVYLVGELGILGISTGLQSLTKKGLQKIILAAVLVSSGVCGVQLYLELYKPYYGYRVISTGFDLYGHGGPQFWTLESGVLSVLYIAVACVPLLPLKGRLVVVVPRTRLYYVYLAGSLFVHILTCVGALLVSFNKHDGLCITDATSYLYYAALPIFAYVCLLRPDLKFSRPNILFSYSSQVCKQFFFKRAVTSLETFLSLEKKCL